MAEKTWVYTAAQNKLEYKDAAGGNAQITINFSGGIDTNNSETVISNLITKGYLITVGTDDMAGTANTVTVNNIVAGVTSIAVDGTNYKLEMGGGEAKLGSYSATVSEGTATITAITTGEGFVLNGNTATYCTSGQDVGQVATITGLSTDATVSDIDVADNGTITVSADALKTGDNDTATLTVNASSFTLKLGNDVNTDTTYAYAWKDTSTGTGNEKVNNVSYIKSNDAKYTLSGNTITCTKAADTTSVTLTSTTAFTINEGAINGVEVDTATNKVTVTLSSEELTNNYAFSVDSSYSLVLKNSSGNTIATSAAPAAQYRWVKDENNSGTYSYQSYIAAYYATATSNGTTTVTYHALTPTTIATISGLESGLTATAEGTTSGKWNFGKAGSITVSGGGSSYTLNVDAGLIADDDSDGISIVTIDKGTGNAYTNTLQIGGEGVSANEKTATGSWATDSQNYTATYSETTAAYFVQTGNVQNNTTTYTYHAQKVEELAVLNDNNSGAALDLSKINITSAEVAHTNNKYTVTLNSDVLKEGADVSVTLADGSNASDVSGRTYTLALATGDKAVATSSTVTYEWVKDSVYNVNNGGGVATQADYLKKDSTYYTLNTGTNTITCTKATDTVIASISGLKKNFDTNTFTTTTTSSTANGVTTQTVKTSVPTSQINTLEDGAEENIELTDKDSDDNINYTFVISGANTFKTTSKQWEVEEAGTAKLYEVVSEYYTKDGTSYSHYAKTKTHVATITGLKSTITAANGAISGITVRGNNITLDDAGLFKSDNGTTVTLANENGGSYMLALGSNLSSKVVGITGSVSLSGYNSETGGANITANLTEGYKIDDNRTTITHYNSTTGATLATIEGLKTGLADAESLATVGDGTITLKKGILAQSESTDLTITTGAEVNEFTKDFTFKLCETGDNDKVTTAATDKTGWGIINGTTAIYKTWETAYWSLSEDNKTVEYHDANDKETHATITGLNLGAVVASDSSSIGLYTDSATYVEGLLFSSSTSGGTFTFNAIGGSRTGVLNAADATLGNTDKSYALSLNDNMKHMQTGTAVWTIGENSTTATYDAAFLEGYTIEGNTIKYSASESSKTLATLSGLKNGVSAADIGFNANSTTFILDADALSTETVSLTNDYGTTTYTLGLKTTGDGNDTVTTVASPTDVWMADGTNKQILKPYYSLGADSTTVNYNAERDKYTYGIISGLDASASNTFSSAITRSGDSSTGFTFTFNDASVIAGTSVSLSSATNLSKLELGGSITKPASDTMKWGVSAGIYTYQTDYSSGYTLADSTHINLDGSYTKVFATFTGLKDIANGTDAAGFTGVSLSGTTFTINSGVLGGSDVTLVDNTSSTGYTLSLGADIATSTLAVNTLSTSGSSATYAVGYTDYYGYSNASHTGITYTAATNSEAYISIAGIAAGLTASETASALSFMSGTSQAIVLSNNTLTFYQDALTNTSVNVIFTNTETSYTLALDTGVDAPSWDDVKWSSTSLANASTTGLIYMSDRVAGYTLSGTSIAYTAAADDLQLAKITGLNIDYKHLDKIDGISVENLVENGKVVGKTFVISKRLLGENGVTITTEAGGSGQGQKYKLAIANDVPTAGTATNAWAVEGSTATYKAITSGYYTLNSETGQAITYNGAEDVASGTLMQIAGLKDGIGTFTDILGRQQIGNTSTSTVGITINGSDVTLTNSVLDAKDVTLTDGNDDDGYNWSLNLANDVDTVIGYDNFWKTDSGSATFYGKVTDSGYKLADANTVSYKAVNDTNTFTVISGLVSTITGDTGTSTISGIALSNNTFTLSESVLDLKDVSITSGSGYKLNLADDATLADAIASRHNAWQYAEDSGTASYQQVTPKYYTVDDGGEGITYHEEAYSADYLKLDGFKTVDNGNDSFTSLVDVNTTTKKITLGSDLFGNDKFIGTNSTIALTAQSQGPYANGYKLVLGDGVNTRTTLADVWANYVSDSGTAVLQGRLDAGYEVKDGKTVSYSELTTSTQASISGLKTDLTTDFLNSSTGITFSGADSKTLVLNLGVLNGTDVTLTEVDGSGYKLSLGDGVASSEVLHKAWDSIVESGTKTGIYYNRNSEYYDLQDNPLFVQYVASDTTKIELAKLTGLKSDFEGLSSTSVTNDVSGTITLGATALGTNTVKLESDKYSLQLADGVQSTSTTAAAWGEVAGSATTAALTSTINSGYTLADSYTIDYTPSGTLTFATITGIKTNGGFTGITYTDAASKTIRLATSLLGQSDVTLADGKDGTGGYTFAALDSSLAVTVLGDSATAVAGVNSGEYHWQADVTSGYTLANSQFIDYTSETKKNLATISGLKSGSSTALTGTFENQSGTCVFTLTADLLNHERVTLTDNDDDEYNFSLAIDSSVADQSSVKDYGVWTSGTSANHAVYTMYKPEYYTLNGDVLDYTGIANLGVKAQIIGLDEDWTSASLLVDSSTKAITVAANALTSESNVTLNGSSYTLKLGADVGTATALGSDTFQWTNNGTYAYLNEEVSSGYALYNSSKEIHFVETSTKTLATLSGINLDAANTGTIVWAASGSNTTLTLSNAVLTNTSVLLSAPAGYSLNLADEVHTSVTTHEAWDFGTDKKASYRLYRDAYYVDNDSSIAYNAEAISNTYVTISGLNTGLAAATGTGVFEFNAESNIITLGATALTNTKVTLSNNNYTLDLDDNVDQREEGGHTWTQATNSSIAYLTGILDSGYTLAKSGREITYSADSETLNLATVSGIKAIGTYTIGGETFAKYDTSSKVITLFDNALNEKQVTLTTGYSYTLNLGEGVVTQTSLSNAWSIGSGSASFYEDNKSGFYTDCDTKIMYTADKWGTKKVTVSGLNKNYVTTASGTSFGYTDASDTYHAGMTLAGNVITINTETVLPTANNATVKLTDNNANDGITYTFDLGNINTPSNTALWWNVTGSSAKTAIYKADYTDGYLLDANSTTITHKTARTDNLFTLGGLNSTISAGTSTGISGITIIADGDDGNTDGKDTIKLAQAALGTTKVTLNNTKEYTLDLDNAVNTATDNYEYKWVISGTNAYYRKFRSAYYVDNDSNIEYKAESVVSTLATVAGIASGLTVSDDGSKIQKKQADESFADVIRIDNTFNGTGGAIDGGTITVAKGALNAKDVKLTNGKNDTDGTTYVFALATGTGEGDNQAPATPGFTAATGTGITNGWSVSGTRATLKGTTSAGYTLTDDKTITYSKEITNGTVVTINGIKSGTTADQVSNAYDEGTKTITLTPEMLGTTAVTVSNQAYKLALNDEVPQSTSATTAWTQSGSSFIYKNSAPEYYTYNADKNIVNYTKATAGTTYLTVSGNGLKSGLTLAEFIEGVSIDETDSNNPVVVLSASVLKPTEGASGVKVANGNKVSLSGKKITNGTDYTKYELSLNSDVTASVESAEKSWTKKANATSATYSSEWNEGYKLANDGKSVSYAASTTTLYATLNGLDKYVTQETLNSENNVNIADGVITLNNDAIGDATKITVKGTGYTLALADEVPVDDTAENQWSVNTAKTVAYYKTVIPEHYTVTNTAITKVNEKTTKTLATISGLVNVTEDKINSGSIKITESDSGNVITLKSDVMPETAGKKVTLSGTGYTLAFGDGVNAPTSSSETWSATGNGKATLTGGITEGYTLSNDEKSITYSASGTNIAIATISGLDKDVKGENLTALSDCFTVEGTTITLKQAALTTGNVTVNNSNYTLALDGNVPQDPEVSNYWTVSGSNATYQEGTNLYYEYDEGKNAVVYHRAVNNKNLVQIGGLATGLKAFTDESGNNVFGDGTNAYVSVADGEQDSGSDVVVVTLTKDALPAAKNGAKVTLTDKNTSDNVIYKLAFDDSEESGVDIAETGEATWTVNGTTATYVIPKSAGYTIDANGKTATYSVATETVLAQITGLNNKIEITDDDKQDAIDNLSATKGTAYEVALKAKMEAYLNKGTELSEISDSGGTKQLVTVTLPADILTTTNIVVTDKISSDNYIYNLALDDDVTKEAADIRGWKVNGTTATYQSYEDAYYDINTNTNATVTYKKATSAKTWLTIAGLKSGLQVLDSDGTVTTTELGTIDGIEFSENEDTDVVVLSSDVLPETKSNNSKITIKGTDEKSGTTVVNAFSKYELQIDDTEKATDEGLPEWSVSGSSVVFRDDRSAGYDVSTDGKTLTYAVAKEGSTALTLVTLKGLNLTVTDDEIKEAMDDDNTLSSAEAKDFVLQNRILNGISVEDDTITLSSDILGTGTVSLSNSSGQSYKLALADDVATATTVAHEWAISGTNAYYKSFNTDYYTLNATNQLSITYKGIANSKNDLTVKGLKSGLTLNEEGTIDGIELNGNVVTLSEDVLGTGTISVAGTGYTMAFDGSVTQESSQSTDWVVDGTKAVYKDYECGYYTLNTSTNTSATYTKGRDIATLATVTGLKSGVTADDIDFDGTNFTLTGDMVGTGTITLTNGKDSEGNVSEFKLFAGDGIATDAADTNEWVFNGTTATYKTYKKGYFNTENETRWTYTKDTNATDTITISGLKPNLEVSDDGEITGITKSEDKVTLNATVLNKTNVSLKGAGAYKDYALALSSNATDSDINYELIASGSSVAYKSVDGNEKAYYKANTSDTDKATSYTYRAAGADKPTLYTINNLNLNVTAAEITTWKAETDSRTLLTDAEAKTAIINERIAANIDTDTSTDTVTLKEGILGTSNISLSNGKDEFNTAQTFKLGLNGEVATSTTRNTTSWSINGTKATLSRYDSAYYTLNSSTNLAVTYNKIANNTTLAEITGLKSGLTATNGEVSGISLSSNTIKLDASVLGTSKVALSATAKNNGYKLALDTENTNSDLKVSSPGTTPTDLAWNTDTNKTATYKGTLTAGYTLTESDTSVTYTASSTKTIASVKVNTENILLDNSNIDTSTTNQTWVTLAKADVGNNTTFNISGDYGFKFASDTASATVTGAATDDTIKAEGSNLTFNVGNGDDTVDVTGSAALINGGAGNDRINYAPAAANNLAGRVNGDAGDDAIIIGANAGGNLTISGGAGADEITVNGGGNNRVTGDAGTDTIVIAGTGNNTVYGGADNDTITINTTSTSTGKNVVYGDAGNDSITIGNNADGNNTIYGGAGADEIIVNGGGNNRIAGDAGTDTIVIAGDGNNTVYGGADADLITISGGGNNLVYGDAGNDTITISGTGNNTVYGGAGNDTFVYSVSSGNVKDVIADFGTGSNRLQVNSSITSATYDGTNLALTVSNGTITLKNYGKNVSSFTYYTSASASATVAVTAASADLAESADLIYDDANFTTNDLSDIVNTSRDTFSVDEINATEGLDDLNDPNAMLTYGKDENKNKNK